MNWEAISAIGELVGAIAVIVTIGYLAIQIRQNTSALRAVATQGVTDEAASIYQTLCTDPELATIAVRGWNAIDELNNSETARFYAYNMMTLFYLQNWYFQTRDGHIEVDLLASWTRILQQMVTTQGFQRFWNDRKMIFAPEFQRYVDDEAIGKASETAFKPLGVTAKQ